MTDRRKRTPPPDPAMIANQIRSEIRRILRKWHYLQCPLQTFRRVTRPEGRPDLQVCFGPSLLSPDAIGPTSTGARWGAVRRFSLPDERIDDAFHDFAGSVWHLKDRIHNWGRAQRISTQVLNRRIEKHIELSDKLKICGDLVTEKKHGRREERSGQHPWLSQPQFDTSENGQVEFWYDGAVKEAVLLVTKANPIPFRVDVYRGDDPRINRDAPDDAFKLGDAASIISTGFKHWLPLIRDLGILKSDDDRENKALLQILRPLCPPAGE